MTTSSARRAEPSPDCRSTRRRWASVTRSDAQALSQANTNEPTVESAGRRVPVLALRIDLPGLPSVLHLAVQSTKWLSRARRAVAERRRVWRLGGPAPVGC